MADDKRYGMSEYQMNLVLDAIDAGSMWLALLTTLPTNPDGTGLVEASGGNYGRTAIAFDAASVGAMANTAEEVIPAAGATADLGTILGYAIYDAETVGNLVWYMPLMLGEVLGSADTEFTITNPNGSVMRYTWTTVGTDPGITSAKPAAGDMALINAQNFSAENNVYALVIDSDANWFEIANPDGTAEATVTLGTGSLARRYTTTKACGANDQIKVAAGELVLRMNELI